MNQPEKNSLFADHLDIIQKQNDQLTSQQLTEKKRIESMQLPPLRLTEKKKSLSIDLSFLNLKNVWGLALAGALSLVVIMKIPHKPESTALQPDRLLAKGAYRISLFYEREGKTKAYNAGEDLKDGDKVGASVISAQPGSAFWLITDDKNHVLSEVNDIAASRLNLKAGELTSFSSSFTLTSPNQGEMLVVILCDQDISATEPIEKTLRLSDISQQLDQKIDKKSRVGNHCSYFGQRLRKAELK